MMSWIFFSHLRFSTRRTAWSFVSKYKPILCLVYCAFDCRVPNTVNASLPSISFSIDFLTFWCSDLSFFPRSCFETLHCKFASGNFVMVFANVLGNTLSHFSFIVFNTVSATAFSTPTLICLRLSIGMSILMLSDDNGELR